MLYDLHNPLDVQNARTRLDLLIRKQVVVELTEKKPRRSIPQNAYLHLLLGYFASQTGNTLEWVKRSITRRSAIPTSMWPRSKTLMQVTSSTCAARQTSRQKN